MDILEAISSRKSVRSYDSAPAPDAELEAVRRAGEGALALTPSELRFHLCPHQRIGGEVKGLLGDYGKVIRAPHYAVVAACEAEGYLVDAGYRFEQLILEATRRGLGTCWVGGFFREPTLRAALELDERWRVVALTPLGRPATGGLLDRAIRGIVSSSKRKPLDAICFEERHGQSLSARARADDRLMRVLEAARWAPSWANKQPWRFVLAGREILLYKEARQVKEGKDYHLVDCGIAMAHLHLAAEALELGGRWTLGSFEVPGLPGAEAVGRYVLGGA